MGQTLVLNASYEPLNITTWRRAVVLMIKGKAESLEEDRSYSIHCGRKLPTVIRLRYYVKVPFREVSLTRKNILLRDNNACQYCNYRGSDLSKIIFYQEAEEEPITGKMLLQHALDVMYKKGTVPQKRQICL